MHSLREIEHDVSATIATVLNTPRCQSVSLHEPEFGQDEGALVLDCVDSGWVSSVGKYVDEFEQNLAAYTGAGSAVAVVNGTAALHTCLVMAGVQRGDEVLIPTLTFVATANAVAYTGAVPHFVDSDADRLSIDPSKLRCHLEAIGVWCGNDFINSRTGRRLKAVVVMHVFGHPADCDALTEVAEEFGLTLIEDAAESLGSTYKGRHAGTLSETSALSFNGNKIITTGGGGAILCRDPEVGARAKHLTTTARTQAGWEFVHDEVGFNYRMPNLNAAIGVAQLRKLPDFLERKRRLAAAYNAAFAGQDRVVMLVEPSDSCSNYWLNAILVPDRATRDAVLSVTNANGFMTRPCWTPMHKLAPYAGCPSADLTIAESIADRIVNLPSSPRLVGSSGR